uniref:Uncharacterized protein n=1 Tax=Arundo donax TaxID=35708 RepID=A0A0A9FJ61_ARUDO
MQMAETLEAVKESDVRVSITYHVFVIHSEYFLRICCIQFKLKMVVHWYLKVTTVFIYAWFKLFLFHYNSIK